MRSGRAGHEFQGRRHGALSRVKRCVRAHDRVCGTLFELILTVVYRNSMTVGKAGL